jgi:hypothetical protein
LWPAAERLGPISMPKAQVSLGGNKIKKISMHMQKMYYISMI